MDSLLSINVNDKTACAYLLAGELGGEWRAHYLHNRYFFSREGHAASVSKRGASTYIRVLRGCSAGQYGYRAVSYPLGDGSYGRLYIHRAVCELFVGPQPDKKHVVRHLDCNNQNNRAANLAWGTPKDNAADGIRNGRIRKGEDNHMSRLTRADAAAMRELRATSGLTYSELGAMFGVARMTACRMINGETWQ